MYATIVELSQDERMAARELREDCYYINPSDRDFPDSDDPDSYLSATYNNNEYDGADRDTAGYLDLSDADDRPCRVRSEDADSKPQDVTNSEYDNTEGYYSAEEDAENSFGESSTWYHGTGTSCRCAWPLPLHVLFFGLYPTGSASAPYHIPSRLRLHLCA